MNFIFFFAFTAYIFTIRTSCIPLLKFLVGIYLTTWKFRKQKKCGRCKVLWCWLCCFSFSQLACGDYRSWNNPLGSIWLSLHLYLKHKPWRRVMGPLKTSVSLTPTWLSWKPSQLGCQGQAFLLWIQTPDIFEMWINASQQEKVKLDYLCFFLADSVSKITLLFCSWPCSEPIS